MKLESGPKVVSRSRDFVTVRIPREEYERSRKQRLWDAEIGHMANVSCAGCNRFVSGLSQSGGIHGDDIHENVHGTKVVRPNQIKRIGDAYVCEKCFVDKSFPAKKQKSSEK